MRNLFKSIILAFLTIPAMAQVPQPQINLGGNVGAQGFPVLNSGTLQFTGDADRNMTVQETSATGGIKVTSTVPLTATRNLVLPAGNFQFIAIENATTGGQSIQVIGQSGTGVTIANGASATVWFDGTNVVQTGSSSGWAVFPGTNGIVFNLSTVTARNALFSDIAAMNQPPVNGCSFRYQIIDTASSSPGTTVPDTCPDTAGSPNNGTLATIAPTIGSFGALFLPVPQATPQTITTPIKSYGTLIFHYCSWPRGGSSSLTTTTTGISGTPKPGNQLPIIWGGSATDGADILTANYNNLYGYQADNNPFIWNPGAGGFRTRVGGQFGGCHVEAVVLDASADRIYIDGQRQQLSVTMGSSAYAAVAANYIIGAATSLNPLGGFRGWINYIEGYPAGDELTDTQALSESMRIQNIVSHRTGYPVYPAFNLASTTNTVVFLGDSLFAGFNGTTSWTAAPYFAPTNTYAVLNYGLIDQTAHDIATLFPQQAATAISPLARMIVMMNAATNDLTQGYSVSDTLDAISQTAQQAGRASVLTSYTTMISRFGEDANKDLINAKLINNWRQMGLTAINDVAEIAALGADGAYANTACFNIDQIHLNGPGTGTCANGQSGYSVYAQSHTDTVNYIDGSTFSNPAIASSYPYTMTYGTPVVNATTCASGTCAITLPGCDHMDDMPFYVMNYANAGTVTVTPPTSSYYQSSGYLLNGSSSAVTLGNNTTTRFTELRGSMAAGGCQWISQPSTSDASQLTSGTLADARLSSNVPLKASSNIFTALNIFTNSGGTSISTSNTATSSTNYSSPSLSLTGSAWDGTSGGPTSWDLTNVVGTGTNPTSTLTFTHGAVPSVVSLPILQTNVYIVSALPSASSLPAGSLVTVSDDTGLPASNTCTGGGTQYAIAITNGTSWTCH